MQRCLVPHRLLKWTCHLWLVSNTSSGNEWFLDLHLSFWWRCFSCHPAMANLVVVVSFFVLPWLLFWFRTEGIAGVYQGAFATALKQGSNQGLRFMFFNEYKRYITNDGETQLTPLLSFVGGMASGCFSTMGNNPFDVVKTRMQGVSGSQYKNTLDCFQQIVRNEGIGAFYAGVVPRLGRVVPGQGIIFMSFESIQSFLEQNFTIFRP